MDTKVNVVFSSQKCNNEFWNRANPSVKRMIQSLLFPNGVIYDFETGFGTIVKLDSYLLIKKIPHQNGEEVSLVAATGNGVADRNCVHAGMRHNEEAEERRL